MRGESRLSRSVIQQQRKSIIKFAPVLGRGAVAKCFAFVTPFYASVRLFLVLSPVTPPHDPLQKHRARRLLFDENRADLTGLI